jgi:hypothetical protein
MANGMASNGVKERNGGLVWCPATCAVGTAVLQSFTLGRAARAVVVVHPSPIDPLLHSCRQLHYLLDRETREQL